MGMHAYADSAGIRAMQEFELNAARAALGEIPPSTMMAMNNLAVALNALGAHEAAQELELKVLKLRQRDLGEDHPATLEAMGNLGSTINNIAVALRNDGNLEDAEPLQFEALAMVVKAFGADDLVTACVYSATGALLKLKGDVAQGLIYFNQALEIRERELRADDKLTQLVRARWREMLH